MAAHVRTRKPGPSLATRERSPRNPVGARCARPPIRGTIARPVPPPSALVGAGFKPARPSAPDLAEIYSDPVSVGLVFAYKRRLNRAQPGL